MKALSMFVLTAMMLAMLCGGCQRNPATGERQLVVISKEQEISIGEQAAPEFEQQFGGLVPDSQLQEYVSMVGASVAEVSDRNMPYEYAILASSMPNAFALPGGKVYITAGLMDIMENERELAAVLGHETAHVAARHNVQTLQRSVGAAALVQLAAQIAGGRGTEAEAAVLVTRVITGMANLSYSRDDEYEADVIGIRYMERANHNPYGMVELLRALERAAGQEGGRLQEMFQTHPLTGRRIEQAEEIVRENPDYERWSPQQADPNRERFRRMQQIARRHMRKR